MIESNTDSGVSNNCVPKAFICHASEDKESALTLAARLRENGIDAWIDGWEIRAGDSLRQKIESAIEATDFFIALVSKSSVLKPWVNQELDAALTKKLEGSVRIIPVISDIANSEVPLFLRSSRYVRMNGEAHIKELLDTCLGKNSRPPVVIPIRTEAAETLGLSPSTYDIAREVNLRCKYGFVAEMAIGIDELSEATKQSVEDTMLAATELDDRGYVEYARVMGGPGSVLPQNLLFAETDLLVNGFDPYEDVKTLAASLVNQTQSQISSEELCLALDWKPRRLNPALAILIEGGHVIAPRSMGSAPYIATSVLVTDKTKLFARRVA